MLWRLTDRSIWASDWKIEKSHGKKSHIAHKRGSEEDLCWIDSNSFVRRQKKCVWRSNRGQKDEHATTGLKQPYIVKYTQKHTCAHIVVTEINQCCVRRIDMIYFVFVVAFGVDNSYNFYFTRAATVVVLIFLFDSFACLCVCVLLSVSQISFRLCFLSFLLFLLLLLHSSYRFIYSIFLFFPFLFLT